MIRVSVVIPCYNAALWIRDAIRSAEQQGIEDLEIIVVDDGSTDDTTKILRREFPTVRLLSTGRQGPSHARNVGTAATRGEFFQYLDADDVLAPGKLGIQLRALEQSGADVAYGDWQELVQGPEGTFLPGRLVRRQLEGPSDIALFTADFWCPPAVYLFRREVVQRIGQWPEQLPMGEDARFTLDCALYGGHFEYCPGVMAYYRVPRSLSLSRSDPKTFLRACLRNAAEVETWWTQHHWLEAHRSRALLKVYASIARASFETDRDTFEAAYRALERLRPGYIPENPIGLALISQLVGYRRAEQAAVWFRRLKRALGLHPQVL